MKKSLMTVACVATMLMSVSAYANDYSVVHPFYVPGKGEIASATTYMHAEAKFKNSDLRNHVGTMKNNTFGEDLAYGLSDKWNIIGGYCQMRDKFSKGDSSHKSWWAYLGAQNVCKDDGKTFLKWNFDYFQICGEYFDKTSKGYDLSVTYGKNFKCAAPYVIVGQSNTLNMGKENDPVYVVGVGAYKELSDKFGVNLVFEYEHSTDAIKEKGTALTFDVRYSFNKKSGLVVGYNYQLSDNQRTVDTNDSELKSRNGIFANLFFAF